MELPVLRMLFDDRGTLLREFDQNFSHGRAFVQQASDVPVLSECVLLLVHPDDGRELALPAQVVMVSDSGPMCGVGLSLTRLREAELAQLAEFVSAAPAAPVANSQPIAAGPDDADPVTAKVSAAFDASALDAAFVGMNDAPAAEGCDEEEPLELRVDCGDEPPSADSHSAPAQTELRSSHPHERLRHLTAAQQLKVARTGELSERVMVERLYAKQVWEALLQNPRLSIPEVARIARKGTVPKPLLELILDNPAWIKADAVRRALLGNPKLGSDAVTKLLRATPKHELKLIERGTAYGHTVRESARKLLRQP